MKIDLKNSVLELLPAQVLRLRAAAGVTVGCDFGTLWVTQEGRMRDDFLATGESVLVASSGLTLVEAVGGAPARLTLHARKEPTHGTRLFPVRTAA